MTQNKDFYGRCIKCGCIVQSESRSSLREAICVSEAPYRISGICGGGYYEISKKEFKEQEREIYLESMRSNE